MSVKEQKTIKDIADDVLLHLISNYLDFSSKLEASKVCKRWNEIANKSFKTKNSVVLADYEVNESRIKSLGFNNRQNSIIKMIAMHFFERNENRDKKFIATVLKKYTNLESLCISLKFTKCYHKLIECISRYGSSLLKYVRIELSECSVNNRTLILTNEELKELCEKFSQIKYLYIDFAILYISEQCLENILTKWTKLETFILHSPCYRGTLYNSSEKNHILRINPSYVLPNEMTSNFPEELFSNINCSITKLELPGNLLNLNAINRIPEYINLKYLFITKFYINSMERIVEKFPSLVHFGFTIENNITDEDLYFLMECIGKLRQLESLYFAIISSIPINKHCIQFLRKCKNLNRLEIDQTLVNKESIEAIVKYLPQIESLQLWTSGLNQNFHNLLNDEIVLNIKKLTQLRRLSFRGQRSITDNCIAIIIRECLKLFQIDIRTTRSAILSLNACINRSLKSEQSIIVFIHETPISRLFNSEIKRFEICKNLMLSNEEYDYKINF